MSLHWNIRRQLAPHLSKGFVGRSIDYVLDGFTCSVSDEYRVEGEMMMALPPFVAKFSEDQFGGFLLGVADEDGHLQLLNTTKTGTNAILKGWSAHSNAVFDIAWVNNDNKLVTASGDQTARLWDISKSETVGIFRGHTCSLKSVNIQPQSSCVFATGARDGNVMLWDTRCCMKNGYFGPVSSIYGAHKVDPKNGSSTVVRKKRPRRLSVLQQDSQQSVTSVVFQDDHHIFTAGACDGLIKLWDIRKINSSQRANPVPFRSIPYPGQSLRRHGYSCLVLDSTHSKLFASCTNDTIYMFDTISWNDAPKATFTGHQASTFYIKTALSPDDRFLISGSGDSNVYIWDINKPSDDAWILKGHCGEVTSVAWCKTDIGKIATCSDDNTFRIWRSKNFHNSVDHGQPLVGSSRKLSREESEETIYDRVCKYCERKRRRFATNRKVYFSNFQCSTCEQTKTKDVSDKATDAKIEEKTASPPCTTTTAGKMSPEQLTPRTPRDSKSLMETWLKSPTVSKTFAPSESPDIFSRSPSVFKTPTRGTPLAEKNQMTKNHQGEKRTILIALKSPKDSDLIKGRKRSRNSSPATNLRYAAKRKRETDKENTPNKVQKILPSFSNRQSGKHSPKSNSSSSIDSAIPASMSRKPSTKTDSEDISKILEDDESSKSGT